MPASEHSLHCMHVGVLRVVSLVRWANCRIASTGVLAAEVTTQCAGVRSWDCMRVCPSACLR